MRSCLKEGRKCFVYEAINTFYLQLFGIGQMVKDHSDSERGNPLLPLHGLLFPISSKIFLMCTIPDRITHTMAFIIPVVEHWLEWESGSCFTAPLAWMSWMRIPFVFPHGRKSCLTPEHTPIVGICSNSLLWMCM